MQNSILHAPTRSFHEVSWQSVVYSHRFVIVLGGLLCLPALFSGYLGDDYIHHLLLGGEWHIPKANDISLFGLFSWIDAAPARNKALMDIGAIPWWTYEEMRYQFWRPLAELSHWLDHQLWRHSMPLMHLQSLIWYLLLGVGLHRLYLKSGLSAGVAVFALAAFMLDSTHGFTVSWIANRNALMAAVFGIACLYCYLEWKSEGRRRFLFFSLFFLGCSLLSGEIGISTTCYLGAHALIMDRKGPGRALLSLWPFMLLSCLWWLTYKLGHFGASDSDVNYIDPFESPLVFAGNLLERVPVMLFSQFGLVPAEIYGFSSGPLPAYLAIAVLFLAALLWLVWPLIKDDKIAQFWLLGCAFAVLPVTASVPADRNLLMVGLGASVVIGLLAQRLPVIRQGNRARKYGAYFMLGVHLVLAPALLPVLSYSPQLWSQMMGLELTGDIPIESSRERVLLFGVPMPVALATTPMRYAHDHVLPESISLITSDREPLAIRRVGKDELVISAESGMINQFEQALRDVEQHPFAAGDQVRFSDKVLEVTETDSSGHPLTLRLSFNPDVLGSVVLISQAEGSDKQGFRRYEAPDIGETLQLYPPN